MASGDRPCWAPDYACVRRLFHDPHLHLREPAASRVACAVDTVHRVHDRVGERLVPDGPSLLRASQVKRQDWTDTAFLYDNYFLTRRAPIDREQVIAQLLRRLAVILDDLTAYGLYDNAAEGSELAHPSVRRIESHIADLVRSLIHVVVGDSDGRGDRRQVTLTG